jgi:hypothetical protein
VIEVQLFVAVLGASSYTFAEATWTQTLPDWIGYAEMAAHYVPARPYKPHDKARSKSACCWRPAGSSPSSASAPFFSLAELNAAIAVEVAALNARVTRHLGASRQALFDEIERPALKALPALRRLDAEEPQAADRRDRGKHLGARRRGAGARTPSRGFGSCLGILRLAKTHGPGWLEAACSEPSPSARTPTSRSLHPDEQPRSQRPQFARDGPAMDGPAIVHSNIRGRSYFQ